MALRARSVSAGPAYVHSNPFLASVLIQTGGLPSAAKREYQRLNTTYAVPSNNLSDFAPFRFQE